MADPQLTPQQQELVDIGMYDIEDFIPEETEENTLEVSEETSSYQSIDDILNAPEFSIDDTSSSLPDIVNQDISQGNAPVSTELSQATQEAIDLKNSKVDVSDVTTPTYKNMYSPPEEPGIITKASSKISDLVDVFEGGNDILTQSQMDVQEYQQKSNEFNQISQKVYESTGYSPLGGANFASSQYRTGDPVRLLDIYNDDGEVDKTVIVPKPTDGFWGMVFSQSMDDIVRQTGDLLQGNVQKEGEFSQSIPSMSLDLAADITKDVITFGAVTTSFGNVTRSIVKNALTKLNAPKTKTMLTGVATAIGGASAETIYIPEEDDTLLVSTKYVMDNFGIQDVEVAANLAVFSDAMVLSGGFELLLKPFGWLKNKLPGVSRSVKKKQSVAALSIMGVLDPEFANASAFDKKNKIVALTSLLNSNNIEKIDFGNVQKDIALDTTNTVYKNAETYIKRTRQNVKSNMSDAEWAAYTEKEGALLAQRMIQIAKGNDATGAIARGQASITKQIDEGLDEAAQFEVNVETTPENALDETTSLLINERAKDLTEATENVKTSKDLLNELEVKQGENLLQNETLQAMIQDIDGFDQILKDKTSSDKLRSIIGEDVFNVYKSDFEAFESAYKAIDPEQTPLPEGNLFKLEQQLKDIAEEADVFDSTGGKSRSLLRKISNALTRRKTIGDPTSEIVDAPLNLKEANALEKAKLTVENLNNKASKLDKELSISDQTKLSEAELKIKQLENKKVEKVTPGEPKPETDAEFIERLIGKGNLTVDSLVKLKQTLSNLIEENDNPGVRNRLRELRDSITSTNNADELVDSSEGHLKIIMDEVGDSEITDNILEADQLFKVFKSKFSNSQMMESYSKKAGTVLKVGDTYDNLEDAAKRGGPDLAIEGETIIQKVLSDASGASEKEIAYILGNESFSDALKEHVATKTLRNLAENIRSGNTEGISSILSAINSNRPALERIAPDLLKKLDTIARDVEMTSTGLANNINLAKEAKQLAEEAQAKIDTDFLSKTLLSKNLDETGQAKAVSNPQKELKNLLNGTDAVGNIQALRLEIDKLNTFDKIIAEEALKNTTIRNLRENLFGSSPVGIASGDSTLLNSNLTNIQKIVAEGSDSTLAVVREVFKDDPIVAEGVTQALNSMRSSTVPSRLKVNQIGSDTAANNDIKDAVSTGILLVFGYMNRTAATVRRLSASEINNAQNVSKQVQIESLALILSDPIAFSNALKGSQKGFTKQRVEDAIAILVKGGKADYRSSSSEQKETITDNLEQALPSLN